MMNEQNLREEIADIFDGMTEDDLIYYWNEYCQNNSYYENMIHYQEEFDDYCSGMSPLEIAGFVDGSDITNCKYFCVDLYGLKTGDYFDDLSNIDDLIDYCINCYESIGIPEIDDLLDEFFNQEDEEEEEEEE